MVPYHDWSGRLMKFLEILTLIGVYGCCVIGILVILYFAVLLLTVVGACCIGIAMDAVRALS